MRINIGRVVIGGLVAGVVLNVLDMIVGILVLADDMKAMVDRLNLDPVVLTDVAYMAPWIVIDFLYGLLIVWTYAAIRPRFGPGPRTALVAGLLLYAQTTMVLYGFMAMGVFERGAFVRNALCYLVSTGVASLAGCALYREA
jgi:hypothetical protein